MFVNIFSCIHWNIFGQRHGRSGYILLLISRRNENLCFVIIWILWKKKVWTKAETWTDKPSQVHHKFIRQFEWNTLKNYKRKKALQFHAITFTFNGSGIVRFQKVNICSRNEINQRRGILLYTELCVIKALQNDMYKTVMVMLHFSESCLIIRSRFWLS